MKFCLLIEREKKKERFTCVHVGEFSAVERNEQKEIKSSWEYRGTFSHSAFSRTISPRGALSRERIIRRMKLERRRKSERGREVGM